jgi:predicted GNAT family N-acyltransferase
MNIPEFYLEPANYAADFDVISSVREAVFVLEQNIPAELEFDELDRDCHHMLARDSQGGAIGTGRLTSDGRIGRVAVLREWRLQRVGTSLVHALIDKARSLGLSSVTANAQVQVLGFYEKLGFKAEGATFVEAGIPHQSMRLAIQPVSPSIRPQSKVRETLVQAVTVDTVDAIREASIQLISPARRSLCVYTRGLDQAIYADGTLVEALKQLALRHRNSEIRIIIQEPEALRYQTHPVIDLAQRLSSHFLLRTPLEPEDLQYLSAFVVNDADGYLFQMLGDRYEAHWSPRLAVQNRRLREEFERVWQRSRQCSEFRALSL